MQVHPAMAMLAPAVEAGIAERGIPRAKDALAGRDDAALQRRQRHRDLEGRAGRIKPRDRLVDQRGERIAIEGAPLFSAQAAVESVGIVSRGRNQRQHLAAMNVEHDRRGALVFQPPRDESLQFEIHGQTHLAPGLAILAREFANDAAEGVDLHLRASAGPAQSEIVNFLHSRLADAKTGKFQQRIAGQLPLGDGGDVTEHVRGFRRIEITAGLTDVDHDSGKIGRVYLDARHLLPFQVLAHGQRNEAAPPLRLAQNPAAGLFADRNDLADGVQRRLEIAGLLRSHQNAEVALVDRQRLAIAIHDPAARRRQEAEIDAVLVGERPVAIRFENLEVIHPSGEQREEGELSARQQRHPPGKQFLPFGVAQHESQLPATRLGCQRRNSRDRTGNIPSVSRY